MIYEPSFFFDIEKEENALYDKKHAFLEELKPLLVHDYFKDQGYVATGPGSYYNYLEDFSIDKQGAFIEVRYADGDCGYDSIYFPVALMSFATTTERISYLDGLHHYAMKVKEEERQKKEAAEKESKEKEEMALFLRLQNKYKDKIQ